jgi:hypothetical protein
MLLFQGAGARIPQFVDLPLREVVWPVWTGACLPEWWSGQRFARNLVGLIASSRIAELPAAVQAVQFLPLCLLQAAILFGIGWTGRSHSSNLRVDQQQQRGGADQNAQDPEAEPKGVNPDPRP